jgi:cytochrome c553
MKKVILALALFSIVACKKDEATVYDCTGSAPTYTVSVAPIINGSCATSGCHNATTQASGINLSNYTAVKAEAVRERFMGAIQHLSGYDAMPQGGDKLSEANIKTLYCWIENGMPE